MTYDGILQVRASFTFLEFTSHECVMKKLKQRHLMNTMGIKKLKSEERA